jgi:hypothetical protein
MTRDSSSSCCFLHPATPSSLVWKYQTFYDICLPPPQPSSSAIILTSKSFFLPSPLSISNHHVRPQSQIKRRSKTFSLLAFNCVDKNVQQRSRMAVWGGVFMGITCMLVKQPEKSVFGERKKKFMKILINEL